MIDAITIDTKITLGVIIHLIGTIILIVSLYYKLIGRLEAHEKRHERIEQKIEMTWKWFKVEHGLNGKTGEK